MRNFFNLQRFAEVVSLTSGDDYYANTAKKDKIIYALAGDDSIGNYESSDNVTIYGGEGDDTLDNRYGAKVGLYGGAGNNRVENSGDRATVKTADGDDFIQNSGRYVTIDAGGGNNFIEVISGFYNTITSGAGNDTVLLDDSGTINRQDPPQDKSVISTGAGSDEVTVIGYYEQIDTGAGDDYIVHGTSKDNAPQCNTITGGKGNDKIWGGAGDDLIFGDEGNDFLNGGAGNDTLWSSYSGNQTLTGGAGNDVFVYGGGKDVITDYTAEEDKIKLNIDGGTFKKTYSGKDVIFKINSGTLTVKNGKGKKITVEDSHGDVKTYSATVSSAPLLTEDNFSTSDNLSTIVKNDSAMSADKIETQNLDTLTQRDNLTAYADR